MTIKEARLFVTRFIAGDYTPEEHRAFLEWMEGASFDELESIATAYEGNHENGPLMAGPSSEWIEQLEAKLDKEDGKKKGATIKRIGYQKFRWIAAASVVLLAGAAVFVWNGYKTGKADGLTEKSSQVLSKISVPKGEQRNIVLPDGSKVWLNSASTISYPAQFTGKVRAVELSGEAYFEVASNMSMPFRVKARDLQVEVLGTRFNVMAYEEEEVSTTSLLEGVVRVTRGSDQVVLHQGDKVEAAYPLPVSGNTLNVASAAEPGAILAWKDGRLDFDHTDLKMVLNEIARCYDLTLQVEGNIPKKTFSGKFSRKDDIQVILKDLEFQHVQVRIEGKIIRVTF